MKRILVIGSSGAGKSTFSCRLSKLTEIEVIHLDKLYWQPNWIEPEKDEWKNTLENILQSNAAAWIVDGNYSGTLEMRLAACDTVIFLDMPRAVCIYRVLKRVWHSYGKTRSDMAADCPEKFDLEFLKWIWNFSNRSKPKMEKLLEQFKNEKTIIRLKSKREVEKFFRNLQNEQL